MANHLYVRGKFAHLMMVITTFALQIVPKASKKKRKKGFDPKRKITDQDLGKQIEMATTVRADTPGSSAPKKFSEWTPGMQGRPAHKWHRHRTGIHRWVIRNLKSSNEYIEIGIQVHVTHTRTHLHTQTAHYFMIQYLGANSNTK